MVQTIKGGILMMTLIGVILGALMGMVTFDNHWEGNLAWWVVMLVVGVVYTIIAYKVDYK